MNSIASFVTKGSTANSLAGEHVPQIVGNPGVEGDVLAFLKPALAKLNSKNYKDQPKAEKEAVTMVNNVLKQTGDMMNDPNGKRDPKQFQELAKFFSSPEYGQFAASGKLNPEAAKAAKYSWQVGYAPAISKGVQVKLDEYLYGQAGKTGAPTKVSDAISVQMSGTNITFVPKAGKSLDPVEAQSQADAVRGLKKSEEAINQLVKIGAHLEGTQDYKAYWEANKHVFMPQLFSKYEGLDIGYVDPATKKAYQGGDARDAKNWK